uniref:TBC1 domain family member 20 n=2 Tax=Schistocephalus solidus TaxID=70667 RepID=A0A0X3NKB3_SCHSO
MEYFNLQERYRKEKANDVLNHLKDGFEIDWLRHKALSRYGLVNDDIRVKVWPLLAGLTSPIHPNNLQLSFLESLSQAKQVELDVRRMASMLPPNITPEEADLLISETKRLALSILHEHPDLHYYQGFHDVCYVFLSVLGADEAFAVLNKIVPERFSSFMQKSMDATSEMLQLVFDLLEMTSPDIWSRLQNLQLEPFFTLSWVLTWFTHVLSNSNDIHRLYDLFLATDSIMLIYLSVSVIVCSTVELKSTSDDFGELHHALTHLPMKHEVEKLIACAFLLYQNFGPDKLFERAELRRSRNGNPATANKRDKIILRRVLSLDFFYASADRICQSMPFGKMVIVSACVVAAGVVLRRFF